MSQTPFGEPFIFKGWRSLFEDAGAGAGVDGVSVGVMLLLEITLEFDKGEGERNVAWGEKFPFSLAADSDECDGDADRNDAQVL